MFNIDPKKLDGRLLDRAARYLGANPATLPVNMPVSMPGPPGGGYNRYREMTLEEMLLENRVLFLVGEINHVSASRIMMQMLYLQSVKRDQDINLYINSPGGVVDDTLAIYDIMKFLNCDVATYCIGRAESGGAIGDDSPAVRRRVWPGGGYRDSGGGNPENQGHADLDHGQVYRAGPGAGSGRQRAGSVFRCGTIGEIRNL
jgi:hypothetical protein